MMAVDSEYYKHVTCIYIRPDADIKQI